MRNYQVFRIFLLVILCSGLPLWGKSSVREIQQAIAKNQLNWTAGESWVTNLSDEEQLRLCGAIFPPREEVLEKVISLPVPDLLPARFDWRNNSGNWISSVKNQGSCGSCWDFSAIAQVESWWKIQYRAPQTDPNFSEQFILSCSEAGNCISGGSVGAALNVVQSIGVPEEACFPYGADDNISCDTKCVNWEQNMVTIPGWGYITIDEPLVDVLKSAIYRHPVSATYVVYDDFMAYAGGVYEHVTGDVVAGHAILIVGWDDSESCWICKNSWGPYWGENGYFRIKWGNCNIGTNVEFIWSDVIDQNALMVEPSEIFIEMPQNEFKHFDVKFFNLSEKLIEFAVQDYEIPIKFHLDHFNAWEGDSWWCGDATLGGYANHWLQYLAIDGLDLKNAHSPELVFRGFWAIEDPASASEPYDGWDGFNVWISTDGGETFQVITPEFPAYNCESLWSFGDSEQGWDFGPGIPGWGGNSNGWQAVKFDLSGYTTSNVNIRFAFASDMGFCTADDPKVFGVVLDDIKIQDETFIYFENYGTSDSKMSSEGHGNQPATWLEVTDPVGSIAPHDSMTLQLKIDSQTLSSGSYQGKVRIAANLLEDSVKEINCILEVSPASGVVESGLKDQPKKLHLMQNFPNPFNMTTRVQFQIDSPTNIRIIIFNAMGQQIRKLFEGFKPSGMHEILWDGRDDAGFEVCSGNYYFKIISGSVVVTRKSILIK